MLESLKHHNWKQTKSMALSYLEVVKTKSHDLIWCQITKCLASLQHFATNSDLLFKS